MWRPYSHSAKPYTPENTDSVKLFQLLLAFPFLVLGYLVQPKRMKADFALSMLWISGVVIGTAIIDLGLFFLFDLIDADPFSMAAGTNWFLGGVFGCTLLVIALSLLGVRSLKRSVR